MNEHDSWNEYQKLVLHELKDHSKELEKINNEVHKLHIEIATLKVRSGVWGLIAGTIPVIIAMLIKIIV